MRDEPLEGVTVLVTRAREQAELLRDPLAALGADVILTPSIRFADPEDWAPADGALRRAGSYDWAIFTSANGVEAVSRRLQALSLEWAALGGASLVAIGPATAEALERRGLRVDVVPETYQAEGILEVLSREKVDGKRILLARAARARDVLPETLKNLGALLDVVAVYRTLPCAPSSEALAVLSSRSGPSLVVTFTSSSTVTHFLDSLPPQAEAGLRNSIAAAIGPITADELRRRGLEPRILPSESTVPALVTAIRDHFARGGPVQP